MTAGLVANTGGVIALVIGERGFWEQGGGAASNATCGSGVGVVHNGDGSGRLWTEINQMC